MEIYIQNRQTGKTTDLVRNCSEWLNKNRDHRATIFCTNKGMSDYILSMFPKKGTILERITMVPVTHTHLKYTTKNVYDKFYYDEFDHFDLERKGISDQIIFLSSGYYTTTPKISTKDCLLKLSVRLSDLTKYPNSENNLKSEKFDCSFNNFIEKYLNTLDAKNLDEKNNSNVKREYIVDMAFRIFNKSNSTTIDKCFDIANSLFEKYLK